MLAFETWEAVFEKRRNHPFHMDIDAATRVDVMLVCALAGIAAIPVLRVALSQCRRAGCGIEWETSSGQQIAREERSVVAERV